MRISTPTILVVFFHTQIKNKCEIVSKLYINLNCIPELYDVTQKPTLTDQTLVNR